MTLNDALIQATQELCNILNNKEPVTCKASSASEVVIGCLRATMASQQK